MADLKLPELNYIIMAGNLTKDPVFRHTTNGTQSVPHAPANEEEFTTVEDFSFDKFLTSEESRLLKDQPSSQSQGT